MAHVKVYFPEKAWVHAHRLPALIVLCCCNGISQIKWLMQNRNVFLTVLEAGKSKTEGFLVVPSQRICKLTEKVSSSYVSLLETSHDSNSPALLNTSNTQHIDFRGHYTIAISV